MNLTPESLRAADVHVLDEWAKVIGTPLGAYFGRSDWLVRPIGIACFPFLAVGSDEFLRVSERSRRLRARLFIS